MKILILQDDFPPEAKGGAGIMAFNLAKTMKERGHSIFVITTVQDKKEEDEIEHEGLKIFRIYSKYHEHWRAYISLYNFQTVRKIKKIINNLKPDIIHVHNVHQYLSYHTLKLAKDSGAKVFLTAHDAMLYEYGKADDELKVSWLKELKENKLRYNPFRNLIIRFYLRYADRIIAVSEALKKALENNGIKNVAVIHNGIDLKKWEIAEGEVKKFKDKYGLADKKIVFFGGRLSEAKGGEQIVRAMAEVIKKNAEAILLVAGVKNKFFEEMFKLAAKLGIGNSVLATGWLEGEERAAAYFASDIVVFPSVYSDPFGLVNIEAMASKKPVIATCFGGAKEIVQDGITGYIVNPLNTEIFADRIIKVLSDSDLARQMGNAGYERVKNSFTLERQAEEYLKVFNSLF